MPRETSIEFFLGHKIDLKRTRHIGTNGPTLERNFPAMQACQQKSFDIQARAMLSLERLMRINRQTYTGES